MNRDDYLAQSSATDNSPWMCHVCCTASRGDGAICEVCFRTTCRLHLRRTSVYNKESGLYEFISVCMNCALAEIAHKG